MSLTEVQTGTTPVTAKGAKASTENGAIDASDFETFLRMLTTQIQNQDPLNPMESSDFAVQLATFSGVEQQVQTNDLLRDMAGGAGGGSLEALAGWIGMEARVSERVVLDGSPKLLHFDPPPGAVRTDLVVTGPDGAELRRIDISGEDSPLSWEGKSLDGAALPQGTYRLEVQGLSRSGSVSTADVSTYAKVTEVRSTEDGPQILLADGQIIAPAEVGALRVAAPTP